MEHTQNENESAVERTQPHDKRGLERFWRLWAEGVEIINAHEGNVQEAVKLAWQQALGLIEMREVPDRLYEEFVRLRAEYVDFRLSTANFSVPDIFITEAAARKNADAVIRIFEEHTSAQSTSTSI